MKQHPTFGGIDLNSRFEIAAGLKNVALLQHFIEQLR
jgi:phosphoribosylanthranilate isomerase